MKILWLTNTILPEASNLMKKKATPFGGWLVNSSYYLSNQDHIDLSIAFPSYDNKEVIKLEGNQITYYAFPSNQNPYSLDLTIKKSLEDILNMTDFDLVHIYGTEFSHTSMMIDLCNERNIKSVVSIQGLTSIYSQHFMANLPIKIQLRFTVRDILKRDNLVLQKRKMFKRGQIEIHAIENSKNIIGRTVWDRACTYQINSDSEYYHCNETLREVFYHDQWNRSTCEEFSIFTSQATTPIKGLHFAIEALNIILKNFPKAILYVSGHDILKMESLKDVLKQSSYVKYIKQLISKYKLENHIVFTGTLDEQGMRDRYLKSHVFICPSSIENSPNSLGEAMILGVPSVSAGVGGVADMLEHKKEGFVYQPDAPYMLAYYVSKIFADDDLAQKLSIQARFRANKTHNRVENNKQLLKIYDLIIKERE